MLGWFKAEVRKFVSITLLFCSFFDQQSVLYSFRVHILTMFFPVAWKYCMFICAPIGTVYRKCIVCIVWHMFLWLLKKTWRGFISCLKRTRGAYFRVGHLIDYGHRCVSPVDWACLVTKISPLSNFWYVHMKWARLVNKILATGMKISLYEASSRRKLFDKNSFTFAA